MFYGHIQYPKHWQSFYYSVYGVTKKYFQTTTLKPSLNDDLYSISHKRKNKLDLLTTKDLEDSLSYETAIETLHKSNKEAFEHLEVRIYELFIGMSLRILSFRFNDLPIRMKFHN